jgi:catalase
MTSGGDACTIINFDPNVMSAGFLPSDDPVLKMRSPAYAISFGKRLSNQ